MHGMAKVVKPSGRVGAKHALDGVIDPQISPMDAD
jgi:hypothetical protein